MTPRAEKLASPDFIWRWTLRVHRFSHVLCLVLVLLGASAWWVWSDLAQNRPLPRRAAAAPMSWFRESASGAASAWHADARALSSPVLFARPTPVGFSRGALSLSALKPPPATAHTNENFGALNPPTSLVAQVVRTTPQEAAVGARVLSWPADDVEATRTAARPSILVVGFFAGAVGQPRTIEAATNSVWVDAQSWEAVARVSLDAQGWPLRVMLEKPSTTNRNAQLVQLLRTMNFGAVGSREGRVAVRYEGTGGPR